MNKELIIERYKNPKNFLEKLPEVTGKSINSACGDEIEIYIEIENGQVLDAKFKGNACSICIASTDILLDYIKGKNIKEILTIKEFDLLKNIGMTEESPRSRCATLPLEAVFNAINGVE